MREVCNSISCFLKIAGVYYIYKRRLYTLPFYTDGQCESL